MADLTAYYGNLLLSGTLSGSRASTNNPVRQVADGSINLGYELSTDVSPTLHSGSVLLSLTTNQAPVALSIPKCDIPSGAILKLQSMTNSDTEAGLVTVVSATFSAQTLRYLTETSGAAAAPYWRVMISGVSGILPSDFHEIQLVTTKAALGVPQVGVERMHVRQFTRTAIPGGQPFVKRDGPVLKRTTATLVAVSGGASDLSGTITDEGVLEAFVLAIDGGSSFTFADDLGTWYWAELLNVESLQSDSAGVSTWQLTFQEIRTD